MDEVNRTGQVEQETVGVFRRLWRVSPALMGLSLAHVGLLALFLVGLWVDPRWVSGQPVWLKPAKFAGSIALYAVTLAWMLSWVEGRLRTVRAVGGVTAAMMWLEIAVISLQAARGVRSHFNATTVLDGVLFSVMGVGILTAWGSGVVAAWLLFRQRFQDDALALALRLGMVLTLAGALTGGLMTTPTPAQVEQLAQGRPGEAGSHSVGVADGGPGLPVLGWSSEGGDLRVPHFLGLHAMQALPLLALWVGRGARRLGARARVRLVWAGALAWGGMFVVLNWQALRGEPLLSPGPATLIALGVLAVASLLVAATALLRGGEGAVARTSRA